MWFGPPLQQWKMPGGKTDSRWAFCSLRFAVGRWDSQASGPLCLIPARLASHFQRGILNLSWQIFAV